MPQGDSFTLWNLFHILFCGIIPGHPGIYIGVNMKTNLIYIFADQLRYQSLGYAGDKNAITPNIDKLCCDSADLCNAVSGHPVCAPYRASLLTGKYTTSTGMVINEIRMNTGHKTFAHVLNENGYETAYIGKWHMYAAELGHHFDPKNSFIPKGPDRLGFDGYFNAYNFHHEYYGENAYYHLDTPEKIYCSKYEPDEQTDIAIEQLKRLSSGDKPFAMFLSLGTPHDPWVPENVPAEYLEKFKDKEFTLPPNYLPENDPHADNWAVLSEKERSELTEWMRVYYATTAAGKRDFVFNTVDIMPSLLTMMDMEIPKAVEGSDYSACIEGSADTDNGALMMGTGPTAVFGDGNEWRAIRTKQYTYAVFKSDGQELLFDNIKDPYQMNNLVNEKAYETVKEELKASMWEKMRKIGDNFENNSYYEQNWIEDRIIKRTATI